MHAACHPRGYRAFALPEGLAELELPAERSKSSALTLINAEHKGLIWSERLPTGEQAVLKMYRHRGPVDWWREQRFRFRVQREFDALSQLQCAGIPCSAPLFWTCGVSEAYGRYEILATREIPNAVPLDQYIRARRSPISEAILYPLFTTIARMHRAGIYHGALYPRNILVTEEEPGDIAFYIIDVPKAIAFPRSTVGTRMETIDLLNLCHELACESGLLVSVALLMHDGLDKRAAQRLLARIEPYRPTRHTRNRHMAECKVRKLLARKRRSVPDTTGEPDVPRPL